MMKITPQVTKDIVTRYMPHTISWAGRDASADVDKILRACNELKIPGTLEKCDLKLKYIYYFRPARLTDYQKMLQPKSVSAFCAAFGDSSVRLYQDGEYIAIETVGGKNEVKIGDVLMSEVFYNSGSLKAGVGLDVKGNGIFIDLESAPHLLIAGETGSGKSVFMHQVILSLLVSHSPDVLKLYMIDTKRSELMRYESLQNVTSAYDVTDAIEMLKFLCSEMERRYDVISRSGCRDIQGYNERCGHMSRMVIFIDEFADLIMANRETEPLIVRLAQKARACGIHLVIATQRPDRNVVTGLIKANIPAKVCLRVGTRVNSQVVFDRTGGENLSGKGDLLYLAAGAHEPVRCQSGNVTEHEIDNLVKLLQLVNASTC